MSRCGRRPSYGRSIGAAALSSLNEHERCRVELGKLLDRILAAHEATRRAIGAPDESAAIGDTMQSVFIQMLGKLDAGGEGHDDAVPADEALTDAFDKAIARWRAHKRVLNESKARA
jgi:hypothetical protein